LKVFGIVPVAGVLGWTYFIPELSIFGSILLPLYLFWQVVVLSWLKYNYRAFGD
jgi:hypothetical protein